MKALIFSLLFFSLFVLHTLDFTLTSCILVNYGNFEANPLARLVYSRFGLTGLCLMKYSALIVMGTLLFTAYYRLGNVVFTFAVPALTLLLILSCFVVLNNVTVLLKLKAWKGVKM